MVVFLLFNPRITFQSLFDNNWNKSESKLLTLNIDMKTYNTLCVLIIKKI